MINRATFQFILKVIADDVTKETTKFKETIPPECLLGITLYRLAHGCSYSSVGDLLVVAPSTACANFNQVTKYIVQSPL